MTEVARSGTIDGVVWHCPAHKGCKMSVRCGSFLANRKLTLSQFCVLAYTWALGIQSSVQEIMCGVSSKTVVEWNQYFRDVCSCWLLNHPIRLGGPGCIVEIDESLLARRKYNRGRMVPDRWVFGMYDVEHHIGILEFVNELSRDTLLRVIERNVLPGSVILSDGWAAYASGAILAIPVIPPYEHQVVNHSEKFVDPITGACSNHVEVFWKNAKAKNKAMHGTQTEKLPSYMDEFMWRQAYGKKS